MRDRPRSVTVEEFAKYLGVELNVAIKTKSKTETPPSRKLRQTHPTRSPKQPALFIRKKASELIDMDKVHFTHHALDRLVERMGAFNPPQIIKDAKKTARQLLAGSVEEGAISNIGKVKRLINHEFVDVRYFTNSGWRFVLKPEDDSFIVLTIERINQELIPPR